MKLVAQCHIYKAAGVTRDTMHTYLHSAAREQLSFQAVLGSIKRGAHFCTGLSTQTSTRTCVLCAVVYGAYTLCALLRVNQQDSDACIPQPQVPAASDSWLSSSHTLAHECLSTCMHVEDGGLLLHLTYTHDFVQHA
jgi:hypothetical protein